MVNLFVVLKTVAFGLMAIAWSVPFVLAVPFSQLRYVLLRHAARPLRGAVDACQRALRVPYTLVVRSFAHLCLGCMGLVVRHADAESARNVRAARARGGPCVVAFQHVCFADPIVAGALFPEARFVMKHELNKVFFIFYPAVASGFIDVRRSSPESRAQCTARMVATVARYDDTLALAPEGTRNRGDPLRLLPFKKGAFVVATETGAPVVPVVHYYAERCWDRAYARLMPRPTAIAVKVLAPVVPRPGESVDDLQERVRAAMQAELDKGRPAESLVALSPRDRLRLALYPCAVYLAYALLALVLFRLCHSSSSASSASTAANLQ